jgi:arsenate reductase (thioredoxin)
MNVLFVCIGNSGRSLMAERIFRERVRGPHDARSAGAMPGRAPEPMVVQALAELGIDAADHVPRGLDDELIGWADLAVAVCDHDVCPVVPGLERRSWPLRDPHGLPLEDVRSIRDEIAGRVDALLAELR